MKVLALETATKAGSIAVADEAALIGEVRLDVSIAHAERVMNSIIWLLKSCSLSIDEIDAFAVSIGPGSFTGLRIGLSTIKGLAFSTKKPVVPIQTLDAFAGRLPYSSYNICPMLDARKNEVYTAFYRWEDNVCKKLISEPAAAPAEFIKKINGPAIFMGDGALTYKDLIIDGLGSGAIFPPPSFMSPAASNVVEAAIEKLKAGIEFDPVSLAPFYLRKSEAELNWKG
jgi:tRNA threonylcarbamoyladenosine biosynthesis protein TsaB